jgi:Sec-independent protein secretion pathway component TatC
VNGKRFSHRRRIARLVLCRCGVRYFVMLPLSIKFLLGFSTPTLQPMISGDKYFDFMLRVTLSFAAVFQFPLVSTVLTMWGILPPDYLRRHWRGGVVVVFIAAAIFTPPDVASQLLMAGPLLLLYAIAVIAAAPSLRAAQAGRASRPASPLPLRAESLGAPPLPEHGRTPRRYRCREGANQFRR